MKSILCAVLVLVVTAGSARADEILVPSPHAVAQILRASPRVQAAEAELDAAHARARAARVGPHEISLNVEGARRSIEGDDDVNEWNVGVSRGIRWPWKGSVASRVADAGIEIAAARADQVWREVALEFAETWSEWSLARDLVRGAQDAADDANERVEIQRQRLANGMGLELELDQLVSDAALARLAREDAHRREREAWSRLRGLFPGAGHEDLVPIPTAAPDDSLDVTNQPASRIAQLQSRRAVLRAQLAGRDRLPDPEIGVFWFDELGGTETGFGASITMPLSGRTRRAASDAAVAQKVARIADSVATGFDVRVEFDRARHSVASTERAVGLAREAADAARSAVERMQRGRDLDVVTLTELIVTRRMQRATETILIERETAHVRARLEWEILRGAWPEARVSPPAAPSGDE